MTSRSSFWVSSVENHRRRVWVWIITALVQVTAYVGILTVYLSRIRKWYEEGAYITAEEFREALYQAAQEALGFQKDRLILVIGLAFLIGIQGFSYLYDQKKVDMYHSVPVDKNKRFLVIYGNGIIIYLATTLASLLISVISAVVQGAVNGEVMAGIGVAFVWNFLFFLIMYHTAILAVMLTGNRFITLFASGTFALYEMMLYILFENMQEAFFDTKDSFYLSLRPKLSAVADYLYHEHEIRDLENVREMAAMALPFYGKWFVLAAVILAAAWMCYRGRLSEAAGKAIAFPHLEPVVKVLIVIPVSIGLGMWVYGAGYGDTTLAFVTMIAGGVICSAVMEVIYDFDLKSMFRHLISSGITLAGIVIIFFSFKEDLFGYDKYVPEEDKVESVALVLNEYPEFWNENFNYVDISEAAAERMYITNLEPVLSLALKAQQEKPEEMEDARVMHVLYRLRSGREVGRKFCIDFGNPANAKLLDQIIGTTEYKEGTYQIMTDQESFDHVQTMTYSNGAVEIALPAEDGQKIREAYIKDMEQYDFTLIRNNRPCGEISIRFPNWRGYSLYVYESFENTIAYLKERKAYYPVTLDPGDIDSITVTNYHNELQEVYGDTSDTYATRDGNASAYSYDESRVVSETFYEEEEFAKILPVIYPNNMSAIWHDYEETDSNYDVYITFRKDTSYPYDRGSYGFNYQFYTGEVPEFVDAATAYED